MTGLSAVPLLLNTAALMPACLACRTACCTYESPLPPVSPGNRIRTGASDGRSCVCTTYTVPVLMSCLDTGKGSYTVVGAPRYFCRSMLPSRHSCGSCQTVFFAHDEAVKSRQTLFSILNLGAGWCGCLAAAAQSLHAASQAITPANC